MDILDDLWKSRHSKDLLFLELIDGYVLNVKQSIHYRSYDKDNTTLISYVVKTKDAWINHSLIWKVFQTKFNLSYDEVRELMKGLLETHLKLEGTIPKSTATMKW